MSSEDVRRIILEKLNLVGEQIDDNFEFDYIDKPNAMGTLQIKDKWFIYESDEKNIKSFTGPFNEQDIVYACAKMLHKSKHFEEYRFSNEAKRIYINAHYKSLKEAEENI